MPICSSVPEKSRKSSWIWIGPEGFVIPGGVGLGDVGHVHGEGKGKGDGEVEGLVRGFVDYNE